MIEEGSHSADLRRLGTHPNPPDPDTIGRRCLWKQMREECMREMPELGS